MANHQHLFPHAPHTNLSVRMHDLNADHATWYNRRHQRVGALYQGPPKNLTKFPHAVITEAVSRGEERRWTYRRCDRCLAELDAQIKSSQQAAQKSKRPRRKRKAKRQRGNMALDQVQKFKNIA